MTADIETAVTVVTVRGMWSRPLRGDAFIAVKKALGEHPTALIVDLCEVIDPQATSASTWLTVSRVGSSMEPAVGVAACLPRGAALAERLRRLGARYFLPIYDDLAHARSVVAVGGPRPDRMRIDLQPHPDSPALARNLVTEACGAWGMPADVLYPARLVMSELAANAMEHAATPFSAMVVRRGDGLHLVVSDCEPRLPQLVDQSAGEFLYVRGQGLRTVQAASSAWGSLPTRDGKMVWATVRPGF
ncbi:ATP-binding protein [Actinoplanes bogorensis]|uniref:ATP-binding protein n=1 Tax=Paractinoplanes bogorensis TaxID=1610840 RepID=A0ABS5YY57_9ACTN|nr:ATP-binding protein [Actinoplanes bogorensis]MBU2668390.1 ATP-binding protein [Actinoplanes bogorensis]